MREILFRGKTRTGKWVYGDLIHYVDKPVIKEVGEYWVISETVGQYTGLTDKNGKRIFEGDIVKHFNNSDDEFDIGVIYFDKTFLEWRRTTNGNFHKGCVDTYKINTTCTYEVIGNIHDNPELLKGGVE